jgi:hypothetical protein
MLAATRRLVVMLAAFSGVTLAISVAAGLALGSSLGRAISLGFYVVGSFLVVAGFLSGNRGLLRPRTAPEERDAAGVFFGAGMITGGVRQATVDEREDALATAGLFLILGLALIAIGILADTRVGLR